MSKIQFKSGTWDFDRREIPEKFILECLEEMQFCYFMASIFCWIFSFSKIRQKRIKKHYSVDQGFCKFIEEMEFEYKYGETKYDKISIVPIDVLIFIQKYSGYIPTHENKNKHLCNFYWFTIGDIKQRLKLINKSIKNYKLQNKYYNKQ